MGVEYGIKVFNTAGEELNLTSINFVYLGNIIIKTPYNPSGHFSADFVDYKIINANEGDFVYWIKAEWSSSAYVKNFNINYDKSTKIFSYSFDVEATGVTNAVEFTVFYGLYKR